MKKVFVEIDNAGASISTPKYLVFCNHDHKKIIIFVPILEEIESIGELVNFRLKIKLN